MAKNIKWYRVTDREKFDTLTAYNNWLGWRQGVVYDNYFLCDDNEKVFYVALEKENYTKNEDGILDCYHFMLVYESDGTLAGKTQISNLWRKFCEKYDRENPDTSQDGC